MHPTRSSILLACLFAALTAAAAALFTTYPAAAQTVIAIVNDEPITALDIAHRTKLIQSSNPKPPAREEVLEELVIEKLKLQQAKRLEITIPDAEVDRTLAGIAQRGGRNTAALIASLNQQGIDVQTLKNRLRAELAWRKVLEKNAPGVLMVRDADVVAIMMARGHQPQTTALQYSLHQYVFVMPRGAPDALRAARQKEAESLRARFTSCEEGPQIAREYREVVIKNPVVRLSTDLPSRLQKLLAETTDGKMTPPEPTSSGFEVVAVCGRKEIVADVSGLREVREELLSQRLQTYEKTYLEEIKKKSIISYR